MRTMLELDAIGEVDRFDQCFDVAYYKSHFHEYLAEYYRGLLQKNSFMIELKPYFSKRRYSLGLRMSAYKIVFLKAIKKVLRCGATRVGKFSPKG